MPTLNGKSLDILEENIKSLRQLFPEVECDGKIDFDMLRQILGEYVDDDKERYNFKWNGKGKALRFSQTPSTGTLRPCKEESKDWDDTQNLYIEGDNLEVLKILQKSYHGKIKMIYIDPPYNTGKDFVYPDNYHNSIDNYKTITGQTDEEGNRISTNTEASGRFHTDWLNMMYPRLRLARNLLTDDGVIFISIDDNEVDNLRRLCNEIFGEDNFLAELIWDLGTGTTAGHFTRGHETIICFSKNKLLLENFKNYNDNEKISHGALKKISYKNPAVEITFPKGFEYEGSDAVFVGELGESEKEYIISNEMRFENGKMVAPTTIRAGFAMKNQIEDFIAGKDVYDTKGQKVIRFYFNNNGILFYEKEKTIINPRTVLSNIANTKNGTSELINLFGDKYFDFPKPSALINYLSKLVSGKNSIILDFFSGSATTAHAVMQLNAEDGGNRRFICVQLPEPTQEDSDAFKAGYKNICEIGKERIRRAGEKIKEEVENGNAQLKIDEEPKKVPDIGFKVFKLDSSNLKKWNPDFDNLELTLDDMINNYVPDRTEEDVVYEFMLKMGLDLSYPIDVTEIDGKKVYSIGLGALMMCLDDNITVSVAEGMVKMYNELAPEIWKVIFKDNGFADDCTKTNVKLTLIQSGLEEDAFTTV